MVERFLSLRVRRFLMLVLVVMLAFGPITRAFADDFDGGDGGSHNFDSGTSSSSSSSSTPFGYFWYGPNAEVVSGNTYQKVGVVAYTKYDAALYMLGYTKSVVDGLSASKKSKLINDGGDYKKLANQCYVGRPDDDAISVIPGAGTVGLSTNSMLTAWYVAKNMYGETYSYWSVFSQDLKDSARDDADAIIKSGEEVGGSGTNTPAQGIFPRTITMYKVQASGQFGDTFTVQWDEDRYNSLVEYINNNDKPNSYWLMYIYNNNEIWLATYSGIPTINFSNGYYTGYENNTGETINWTTYCADYSNIGRLKGLNYTYDESTHVMTITNKSIRDFDHTLESGATNDTVYQYMSVQPVNTPVNPDPPIEWPSPDPNPPTPPEPPDPTTPRPPNPWIPIPDEDVTITGDDFQDLLDALNEHCIHLQNSISSNISQLWELQSDLFSEHMNTFWDNLHNDLLWLGECMNFDVNVNVDGEGNVTPSYDDTSVIYWLKQIWGKLPTGINTRPTDPVTDPNGWWDWLTQLLNNLAADLMALGHDKLANVLESLNELRNKFPFSLPWDVAALLGLLVGVPQCPEFDMPCYTVTLEGLQEVGTYHITLEPYETVWEGVKWIETLAFAVYLITHTGGLMDMVTKTVRPR